LNILIGINLVTFVVYKIDIFILSIIVHTTKFLKSFFFRKIFTKIKKPFSIMPKGWKWSGSPYWTRSEFLKGI